MAIVPAMVAAIMDAIRKGGLFSVDVDIVPTKIGEAAHVMLPAATSGEMNLTSMNGERRMRLTERYMDPPGQAMPDCIDRGPDRQQHGARLPRARAKPRSLIASRAFDWKTEEDAFMDGYHEHEVRASSLPTPGFEPWDKRLREPAVGEATGP